MYSRNFLLNWYNIRAVPRSDQEYSLSDYNDLKCIMWIKYLSKLHEEVIYIERGVRIHTRIIHLHE